MEGAGEGGGAGRAGGRARRGRGGGLRHVVDWGAVEGELARLPADFQGARFASLPHVMEVLSSVDPESALEKLKARKGRLEALVDDVVSSYHAGFNKAIHNYSEILRLFTGAQGQVDLLRQSLGGAKMRLGAQSALLEQEWKASVELGAFAEVLERVGELFERMERAEELAHQRRFREAAAAASRALTLARDPGLRDIGAVSEARKRLEQLERTIAASPRPRG